LDEEIKGTGQATEDDRDGADAGVEASARTADEILAAYTDAVLSDRAAEEIDAADLPPELAKTVKTLAELADHSPPSPHLRRQVRRSVDVAWAEVYGAADGEESAQRYVASEGDHAGLWARVRDAVDDLARGLTRQPAWAALAALVVVALAAAFLLAPGSPATPGTAAGPAGLGFWIAAGAGLIVVGLVLWLASRRK
jgi:hypothetical protein